MKISAISAFTNIGVLAKMSYPQVNGRCALHLASLHPYKTPFVLTSGFLWCTQSAPLINLRTPSVPPNIRATEGVLNLECTS